jgi:hypothetical protein
MMKAGESEQKQNVTELFRKRKAPDNAPCTFLLSQNLTKILSKVGKVSLNA